MKILILNGPNLNLLGKREPAIYGNLTFEEFYNSLKKKYADIELYYFQSNIEGELIDKLHEVGFSFDGVILNAGAYTHTSVAIGDAIKGIQTPVIEVHISNVHAREDFRKTLSRLTPKDFQLPSTNSEQPLSNNVEHIVKTITTKCKSLAHTAEAAQDARRHQFTMMDHFGLNSLFLTFIISYICFNTNGLCTCL